MKKIKINKKQVRHTSSSGLAHLDLKRKGQPTLLGIFFFFIKLGKPHVIYNLESGYHRGGWKIRNGDFGVKNSFSTILTRKHTF
jgi:hypothetical protein